MGVASLILGIIALVIAVGGSALSLGWVGSICGILAIIFGIIGKKDADSERQAKVGLVCGIIALAWGLLATVACVACVGCGAAAFSGLVK